jgi:hypothetical protein
MVVKTTPVMVTPNAIADSSATSMAAKPPQKSPAGCSCLGSFDFGQQTAREWRLDSGGVFL